MGVFGPFESFKKQGIFELVLAVTLFFVPAEVEGFY